MDKHLVKPLLVSPHLAENYVILLLTCSALASSRRNAEQLYLANTNIWTCSPVTTKIPVSAGTT